MSELKATRIKMVYNGEVYEDFGTSPCMQLYYRKEEADKVIERLKEQVSEERSAKVDYKISANDLSDGLKEAGEEIRRLHRCVILMTMRWLGAIDEMYSQLDDVNGLDDHDVLDWEKVSNLHNKMDKVLEKWK